MRIVIDMPDGMYNSIIENGKGTIAQLTTELYGIVCRATPLPKGHGALKDVDKIVMESSVDMWTDNGYEPMIAVEAINNSLTVIEADKEAEDG